MTLLQLKHILSKEQDCIRLVFTNNDGAINFTDINKRDIKAFIDSDYLRFENESTSFEINYYVLDNRIVTRIVGLNAEGYNGLEIVLGGVF